MGFPGPSATAPETHSFYKMRFGYRSRSASISAWAYGSAASSNRVQPSLVGTPPRRRRPSLNLGE